MGKLTLNEATDIWVAATDHAQAILSAHKAERQAYATGSSQDDMKAMQAQGAVDSARHTLRGKLAAHVTLTDE